MARSLKGLMAQIDNKIESANQKNHKTSWRTWYPQCSNQIGEYAIRMQPVGRYCLDKQSDLGLFCASFSCVSNLVLAL